MKQLFKQLHLWLSIPAGIFVIIMCFTGAVLVFQAEIQRLLQPSYYYVEPIAGQTSLPLDSLVNTVTQIADEDGKQVTSITVHADPTRTCEVGIAGQKGSYYTLNPYTAQLTGQGAPGRQFFTDMRALHRWLLLPGEGRAVGRLITGISTLFLLIILISGLLIAIPQKRSQWKQFLTAKRGKNSHTWWFTSHRAFGWYCIILLFLMAATGPMWSFGWYRSGMAKLFGIDMSGRSGKGHNGGKQKTPQPNTIAWSNAFAQLKAQVPDYVSISLTTKEATVKTERHHQCASDTYEFDRQGNITQSISYEQLPANRKVMGYAFLLHAGLWGGWFVKLLYLIACVGGIYLTLSGYWLYIKRISKRHQSKSSFSTSSDFNTGKSGKCRR